MDMLPIVLPVAAGAGLALGWWQFHRRGLDQWIPSHLAQRRRRRTRRAGEPTHLLLCVADHFEPQLGRAPRSVADGRVARWVAEYPRLFGGFRDSDGLPPRHSFFFPEEEYVPE